MDSVIKLLVLVVLLLLVIELTKIVILRPLSKWYWAWWEFHKEYTLDKEGWEYHVGFLSGPRWSKKYPDKDEYEHDHLELEDAWEIHKQEKRNGIRNERSSQTH